MTGDSSKYVLATGAEAVRRLKVVNDVHGNDSRALLQKAGLKPGMKVADIGCGTGNLTLWMAEWISPMGSVNGVDISEGQIQQARENANGLGLKNTSFTVASAYDTGLPKGGYDLVYSRFLLMHLDNPFRALREMSALVKPGGVLVCEDGDFKSPFSIPENRDYERCFELYCMAGESEHAHFQVGLELYRMFLDLGYAKPNVALVQPVIAEGEAKRLPEWTLEECSPLLINRGLAKKEEIDALLLRLSKLAQDRTVLFAMARMTQVWAEKQA